MPSLSPIFKKREQEAKGYSFMTDWYRLDIPQVIQAQNSNLEQGLSTPEAQRRLAEVGANELVERGSKTIWSILWEQLTGVLVVILIISAGISAFLGEIADAVAILVIVILNAILGLTQEYRAEQAIAALKRLAVPTVRVRRDGQLKEISARDLVPGDIVVLEAGNVVPADGRLIQSSNMRVEEAALTGESVPVEKSISAIHKEKMPLGDQVNMVFMGTVVTYGRGLVLVTNTGMKTELGNIAELIQSVKQEDTPLQRRLDSLAKVLAYISFAIIGIVIILGLIRSQDFRAWLAGTETFVQFFEGDLETLFLTGISLAVAAVPEGLPAVVTICLALGSQRMLKRNTLIRKLPAVETLGSVTVICSDKTGTLTENRMTVTVLDVANEDPLSVEMLIQQGKAVLEADSDPQGQPPKRTLGLMLKAMALCNDAVLAIDADKDGKMERTIGDPTEGALVVAAAKVGLHKTALDKEFPRMAEVPFTSERKRMTTIHKTSPSSSHSVSPWGNAPYVAFCKGAVDSLLEISTHVWTGDQAVPVDSDGMRERINRANVEKAQNGQRVLGVAYRPVYELPMDAVALEGLEAKLVFLGVAGLLDPPRPEVKEAVKTAKSAGIRPIMITGDHPLTARHIAQDLGISDGGKYLTGHELAHMTEQDLARQVEDVNVYARVSPEHKLNIVQALQAKGQIVAMTGDGVNDAPALKKAEIGVAMGITGTDVSKEAADMVLLDDNFATIVAAIEEGRTIFDNIRKFIKYILSSNVGELFVMFIGPLLGMPLPLVPLQILWINLVTDGLPGIALAIEPAERGIMKRPPYQPGESIFSRGVGRQIVWIGSLLGFISLGLGYLYWLRDPNGPWQTMVFTTLTLGQMSNVLALRSNTDSLFQIGFASNRAMLGAVILTTILQLFVIYVPFMQHFFETRPLSVTDLLISLAVSSSIFWAIELEKWWLYRRQQSN